MGNWSNSIFPQCRNQYCEIGVPAVGWGNVDLLGKPIKGLEKLTKPGQ